MVQFFTKLQPLHILDEFLTLEPGKNKYLEMIHMY